MLSASSSAFINQALPSITNGIANLFAIIASAFFGGFFAGWWSNRFDSKRRIKERRVDKYNDHRNTVVQIEHELIPLRVNNSRNIEAIKNAIEHTYSYPTKVMIRVILRLYKLKFSTGLNLKLINLDLINKYAILYSDIESFNSDIQYLTSMVSMILEENKNNSFQPGILDSYKQFLPVLMERCEDIDKKSLELISYAKVAVYIKDKKIIDKYIKDGEEIKYAFDKKSLQEKTKFVKKEEDYKYHKKEKRQKFYSPYLDLIRIPI